MAIAVAIMGPVGSGKSTFVKAMTGRDDVVIGNNLTPGGLQTRVKKQLLIDVRNKYCQSIPGEYSI